MTSQAIKLIKYDHWTNEKVYTAMSQVTVPPPRTIELCHIYTRGFDYLAEPR